MPRPSEDARAELKRDVEAAMARRAELTAEAERIKSEAEAEFWRAVDQLRRRYFGAQNDVVAVTKYSRDHILKRTQQYAPSDSQDGANGDQR